MKKISHLKRFVSLMAAITVLLSYAGLTVQAKTASDAKKSVVAVFNQAGYKYGTGFAIGEVGKPVEYIVTNNHVVNGEDGNTTAVVYFSLASDQKMLANIYYYNEEKDVAVLRLPEPTTEREAMVLCPMRFVDIDDTFAALGYPGNQDTDWLKFNTDDITVTKGGIKKADRIDGQDVYMLDLAITSGNSGGPLVDSNGEVVGINTFGLNDDNYALAIDELINVINTDRIPVTIHSSNLTLLIIIGAVILLAIIALVAFLIMRGRGEGVETQSVATPPGKNPTQPKKTPPSNKSGVRVIALGGALNGRKYSVNGSIRMGRDSAQCGIAFPVNTQGVSGVHCEIVFDGSVCYLKDLNSSYGTFMTNGRKIPPNTPQILRSGDKFYLASPENTFEVRF